VIWYVSYREGVTNTTYKAYIPIA